MDFEEKELKRLFNQSLYTLKRRLIHESAVYEASQGISDLNLYNYYKKINYEEIKEKGIYRIYQKKKIHITGEEALITQIESFKERSSKAFLKKRFIENYVSSIIKNWGDVELAREVEKKLNRLSSDKLSYLINKGKLPSIQYYYATDEVQDKKDFLDMINKAIDSLYSSEYTEFTKQVKEIEKIIKMRVS